MDEHEKTASAEGDSPFAEPPVPRLSILHLMLWMLCSGLYLALTQTTYTAQTGASHRYDSIQRATSVFLGPISGAMLAGSLVLIYSRIRSGSRMLRHPGHWLLLIGAGLKLVYLLMIGAALLVRGENIWPFVLNGAIILAAIIPYLFAIRRTDVFRWKVLFGGMVALHVLHGLFYFAIALEIHTTIGIHLFTVLSSVANLGNLLLAGWLVVIAVIELCVDQRRDWLHWTGVAAHVANSAVSLIWIVGRWFIGT